MSELPTATLLYAENFQLECYRIAGFGDIPVVDGWIQISVTASYVPSLTEQNHCVQELATLANIGKKEGYIRYWHFLRKSPGLKLRWQLCSPAAIAWLMQRLSESAWPWMSSMEADSVFGQRELLQGHYSISYGRVLDMAATTFAFSPYTPHPQNLQTWVSMTCQFILCFIPDPWLAWEALGRFGQMRSQPLGNPSMVKTTHCPKILLEQWHAIEPELNQYLTNHKSLLTGTLMLLNYIFNIWGIDAVTQTHILEQARQQLRPQLAGKDIS